MFDKEIGCVTFSSQDLEDPVVYDIWKSLTKGMQYPPDDFKIDYKMTYSNFINLPVYSAIVNKPGTYRSDIITVNEYFINGEIMKYPYKEGMKLEEWEVIMGILITVDDSNNETREFIHLK